MNEKNKQVKRANNRTTFPIRMQPELMAEIHEVKPVDTSVAEFIRASIRLQVKVLKDAQKAS